MFTQQELQNLSVFMSRVDIKGGEAMAMAEIQIKIGNQLQALQNPPPAPAPEIEPPPGKPLGELPPVDKPDGKGKPPH